MSSPPTPGTSPILEECERLRTVQSSISELWQAELYQYEHQSSNLLLAHLAAAPHQQHDETRNRPNTNGEIDNASLFPYHKALYPLLDCYDSIKEDDAPSLSSSSFTVRPSPAPKPFEFNGHRRSLISPRVDRHGMHIEELATLEGHLPNSAWSIKQLMPADRRVQFGEYELQMRNNSDAEEENGDLDNDNQIDNNDAQQVEGMEPDEVLLDEESRRNHTRFWNVLMNPVPENSKLDALSDDVSIPPDEPDFDFHRETEINDDENDDVWEDVDEQENNDDEWEDVDEQENNDDEWEDVDEEENETSAADNAKNARDFTFLKWWEFVIVKERRGVISSEDPEENTPTNADEYSPENLFKNNPSASLILFKVLKHSLSDLQREFRLARAVVLLMADWRLCDSDHDKEEGFECLRQLLSIVASEYVSGCGGYCHEWHISNGGVSDDEEEYEDVEDSRITNAPNHYCSDWWNFLGSITTLLSCGITYMTQQHANIICAFVMEEINRASVSAESISGKNTDSTKAYLKQNIHFINNASYDAGEAAGVSNDGAGSQLNSSLLLAILSGLRQHAVSDRVRLVNLLDELNQAGPAQKQSCNDVQLHISKCLQSFQACIEMMVDIGERCLLRLPTNLHSRQLGGMIVRGLVEAYVSSEKFTTEKPLTYLSQEMGSTARSIIDPLRYAEAVANASTNPLLDPSQSHNPSSPDKQTTLEQLLGFQPPKDVQDIVKGLFMRDLVEVKVSGCGYGDFLSWCNLPIHPEPLLFDYITNFPNLTQGLEDGEPQNRYWVIDEDGIALDHSHLSARYDFSLLVFLRQWHSPWSPESHLSFSVPYRRAISTLALCAHRYGVPHDISAIVNSFLPRDWWPDDRRHCWCRECQVNQLSSFYHQKITARTSNWGSKPHSNFDSTYVKSPALMACPGCQVALACSKDHLKFHHQDGHKRYCGLPPFRAPFSDEDNALCRQILGPNNDDIDPLENDHNRNEEEDGNYDESDDAGSWESVDSNDEVEETSKSEKIHQFFNEKSYQHQRREAPPFANFF